MTDIAQLAEIEYGYGSDTENLEVIVKYGGDLRRVGIGLGIETEDLGEGFAIITLRRDQIPLLYDYNEIEYIEMPKNLTLSLDRDLQAACIGAVQRPDGYNLTGKGVIVGIIDSGIDYTHESFRNPDGSSRILYIWDQTQDGNPPHGFKQGTEYGFEQINMALSSAHPFEIVPSTDTAGHGTAVSGIAAGGGENSGRGAGTAPEASLIIVKLGFRGYESFARTTEIMRALKYIADKAEYLNMPAAINISFGSNDGAHDGNSLFETYINAQAQRWKNVIVVAAGNEGAAGHHYSGNIEQSQTIDAEFVISERIDSLRVTFWKHFADRFILELILPNGQSTGMLSAPDRFVERNMDDAYIRVFYGQPTHYNEDQEIVFLIQRRKIPVQRGVWNLRVTAAAVVDGRFDIWLPTSEEVGRGTAFTRPSPYTTLTLPSTAKNVISVGGYNAAINAAAQFSGRGFTRNNVYVKPDLVAPAVGVTSARAGGGYDSFTGTSMAAPFVTGAAALMMQWGIVLGNDPFLYGQRVKAFLKNGADRSSPAAYPSPVWGYGSLCLKNSMDYLMFLHKRGKL